MNRLCTDVGSLSINKSGEQLCGDHVEVVTQDENSSVIVLADGLGSGVKASILSTLTSKILSTMLAQGMSVEDCVSTVAETLPVCKERGVAYSTFTVIRIIDGCQAELVQYDNPQVILLRDGKNVEYRCEHSTIGGKDISRSRFPIYENDLFIAISDGAIHAGIGKSLNFGWQRPEIIDYMEAFYHVGFTAKTLATILLDHCNELYGGEPGDDTTVCAVRIRRREPVNLIIGPPADPNDCKKMMSLFFAKEGRHIVCGGTTSKIAADYLRRPLTPNLEFLDPEIPPTASLEGADLVTEGVITINKVLSYAQDYLAANEAYTKWCYGHDGASLIARMLFEQATDISFFVGRAVNPAHQNPGLPINFNIKMRLVEELSDCLKKMGKRIIVSYF